MHSDVIFDRTTLLNRFREKPNSTAAFTGLSCSYMLIGSLAKSAFFSGHKVTTAIGKGIGGILGAGAGFLKAIAQKIKNPSNATPFGKTIKDYTIKGVSRGYLCSSAVGQAVGVVTGFVGAVGSLPLALLMAPVGAFLVQLAASEVIKNNRTEAFDTLLEIEKEFQKYNIKSYLKENKEKHLAKLNSDSGVAPQIPDLGQHPPKSDSMSETVD